MPTLAELFELNQAPQDTTRTRAAPPDSANRGVRPRTDQFNVRSRTTMAGFRQGVGNRLRAAKRFIGLGLQDATATAPDDAPHNRLLDALFGATGEVVSAVRDLPDDLRGIAGAARETVGGLVGERREFFEEDDAEPFDLDRVLEEQGSIPEILALRRKQAERLGRRLGNIEPDSMRTRR